MTEVSDVWKHSIKDENFAICKHCVPQKQPSYKGTTPICNSKATTLQFERPYTQDALVENFFRVENKQSKIVEFKAKPPK